MPPKDKPSKKAVKEKQNKAIDEATFGIKNKNKSKKVQQFISRVEKSVKRSGPGLEIEKNKEMQKEEKLMKKLQEEQMRFLLKEAIGSQFGVKKTKAAANAAQLGLDQAQKEVTEFLEALSSDSESDDDSLDDNRDDVGGDEMELEEAAQGIEVFREKTIEDIIEEQRAKLAAEGKKGTPVTEESFAKWRAEKLAKKQAEAEARVKAESTKKKGGKGLSVLSGKELFAYNASLFVDDESAFDTSNDNTIDKEILESTAREEQRIRDETERAQAEQMRLFEVQRIEMEVRQAKDAARRIAAADPNRRILSFNGVQINAIVFEDEEEEDLTLFSDEPYLPFDVRQMFKEGRDLSSIMEMLTLNSRHNHNNQSDDGGTDNQGESDNENEGENEVDNDGEDDDENEDDDGDGEEDNENDGDQET